MPEKMVHALPLQGKRILVTRTREQAASFSERLRALGAIPVEFPTIGIAPPQDRGPLDDVLRRLGDSAGADYDWLVFTSANGVNICCERLLALGLDPQKMMRNVRIAAIGPATAAALARYGLAAGLVPSTYIAESIAAELGEDARRRGESLQGKRILLARAAGARKVLVNELQRAGAQATEVAVYHTLPVARNDEQGRAVVRMLRERELAIITFTSSSTVRHFMQWLAQCEPGVVDMLTGTAAREMRPLIACIGPITSQTARELGLNVQVEAKTYTIDGLIDAIIQHEERA